MSKPSLLWIEQSRLDALFEQISPSHARANNAMLNLPQNEALLLDAAPAHKPRAVPPPAALSFVPKAPNELYQTKSMIRRPDFDDATSEPSLEFDLPSGVGHLSFPPQTPPAPLPEPLSEQEVTLRAEEIAARFEPFRQVKSPPPAYQPLHAVAAQASLEAFLHREPVPVGYLTDLTEPLVDIDADEIVWNLPEEENHTIPIRLPLSPIAPLWMPPPSPERNLPIFLEDDRIDKVFERFIEWLLPSTGACMAFLCDEDGLPLASADATEEAMSWSPILHEQIMAVRSAFPDQHQQHLAARSLCLQIDQQYALSLFWLQTPLGPMTLGIVRPDPIEDTTLCPFLGALQDTIARFA